MNTIPSRSFEERMRPLDSGPQTSKRSSVPRSISCPTMKQKQKDEKKTGAMSHDEKSHLPNWTGLLGWSTKYHDGTSASQLGPMDAERRRWLEKALTAAFDGVEDPFKLMQKAVSEISSGKVSTGLDLLDYTSDFPDCAQELDKLGALLAVLELVKSDDSLVVRRSLEVLNLYLPNNPPVQIASQVKYGALDLFKGVIGRFQRNDDVVHSALSTMGSLIRNVDFLEKGFLQEENLKLLVQIAELSDIEHTVQKAVSIMCHLSERHDTSRFAGLIERITIAVYSRRGSAFANDNVQFWEIAAKLKQIPGSTETCQSLFRQRLEWLLDLGDASREIYAEEIRILS